MNMRPFSHLGDQQLLAQTQRLAGNRRCLEVHILDHLGEIDRRGLALRRGFSSLFDYAVRELQFSDAAAQRRIQALRLCRRHGWVRDKLQNGALTLTAAAQLETAIAGAERHGKQEVARRGGAQPAGNGRPPGGRGLVGGGQNVPAGIAGAAPAAATGAATAGIADAAPAATGAAVTELAGAAAAATGAGVAGMAGTAPAAATGAAAAGVAGAAPAAVTSAAAGEPVAAPGAAAACAQPGARAAAAAAAPPAVAGDAPPRAQCRGDVAAIDQPRPLPAAPSGAVPPRPDHPGAVPLQPPPAPLRDPQRQRALIEQAAGLSTRQVAGLIAAAAPELPLRRDTLRALGAGTFSLTITIDQECQRGLHLLKGLLAHRDPRMSWSDLVARLVREAVDRHDPSRGGRGQRRRQSASSASEAPAGTPSARRCAGAAADALRTAGSATPAPECETGAAAQRRHPVPVSLSEVPPRAAAALPPAQSGPPAGDRTGVAAASAAAPVPQSAPGTSARDHPVQAAAAAAPAGTPAPQSGHAVPLAGDPAEVAASVTPAPQSAPDTSPAGGRTGAATGTAPAAPRARGRAWPAASRRAIPAAVRRLVWQRDQGRCCYRDPISGRRCTSAHLLQIDHLLPVAQGGGADPENLRVLCSAHHRQRHRGVPVYATGGPGAGRCHDAEAGPLTAG